MSQNSSSKFAISLDPKFGDWLRKMRNQANMSQQQLADKMGVSIGMVTVLERAQPWPHTLGMFMRLAEALNLELGFVLHKAGLPIGREGLNSQKMRRADAIGDAFTQITSTVRMALAEGINVLNPHLPPLVPAAAEKASADMGIALGVLDAAETRLRADGFVRSAPDPETEVGPRWRRWSPEDDEFLRSHPNLPHEEVSRILNRTIESVRNRRTRIIGTSALKGEA